MQILLRIEQDIRPPNYLVHILSVSRKIEISWFDAEFPCMRVDRKYWWQVSKTISNGLCQNGGKGKNEIPDHNTAAQMSTLFMVFYGCYFLSLITQSYGMCWTCFLFTLWHCTHALTMKVNDSSWCSDEG